MNPTALIINPRVRLILVLAAAAGCEAAALAADGPTAALGEGDVMSRYVRVSPRDSRYLELSDGTPYIPNGLMKQGLAPEELRDVVVPWKDGGPLAGRTARAYDPWKKVWTDARIEDDGVRLPAFARSIVVRLGPG